MTKDEFERLESYTKDLEALRLYSQVKKDRDSLVVQVARLKEQAQRLMAQLEMGTSAHKKLSSRLSERESEVKELASRLAEADGELSLLRDFKVKLPESGGLTLDEMRNRFLQAEEEEIERRAQERFGKLEKDIRSRMPSLVHKRLMDVLKRPSRPREIEKTIHSRARQVADRILGAKDEWPDWFKDYYLGQVNESVSQGLDSEFQHRVEAEAQRRLVAMKGGKWSEYTARKAKSLAAGLRGAVGELQGTRWFTCDMCGRSLGVEIGPPEIGALLKGGAIDVACTTCSDSAPFPLLLSTVPHKVGSLTLERLLQLYMGEAPSTR